MQLTSFVGRAQELAGLSEVLGHSHLVTITGPGGIGKSRLAEEAARDWPDPHATVRFQRVPGPEMVAITVAAALALREEPGRRVEDTLRDHFQEGRFLLILDGCDNVREACAALATSLLEVCPGLTILATSRERLRVPGEVVRRVEPLPVAESIELLQQRARLLEPGFSINASNRTAAAELCERLDGLPLALELASARLAVLSPGDVLTRLADRFKLLRSDGRSLRAVVELSTESLTEAEARFFRRLGVFAGSFDLPAAAEVAGGADVDELEMVTSLVDKSLIQTLPGFPGSVRYQLLDTIRDFAREALESNQEADRANRRLAERLAREIQAANPTDGSGSPEVFCATVRPEHENLVYALGWSRDHDPGLFVRLAAWASDYFYLSYRISEGRDWCVAACSLADAGAPEDRVHAMVGAGYMTFMVGDQEAGIGLLENALALGHDYGLTDQISSASTALAGLLAQRGDIEAAVKTYLRQIDYLRIRGSTRRLANYLFSAASLELTAGRLQEAADHATEAAALGGQLALASTVRHARFVLFELARRAGDSRTARSLYEQIASPAEGEILGIAWPLTVLLGSALAIEEGRLEDGARLAGLHEAIAPPRRAFWMAELRNHIDLELAALPAERLGALAQEGEDLGQEGALEIALRRAPEPVATRPGPLTAREREVAALVAQGLTNRQIAGRLFIAERSAEGHIERIRNKLGFTSRTQVAVWATEQGLGKNRYLN